LTRFLSPAALTPPAAQPLRTPPGAAPTEQGLPTGATAGASSEPPLMEQLDAPQAANGGVGPEVLPSDGDTYKQ